jgi:Holliday junction resolvasome RuvABC endonuclease subunit
MGSVIGIDSSTNSLAFAVFEDTELKKYGKIEFEGNVAYDRLSDSLRKVSGMKETLSADFIAIEKAVMVRSADTAIKMGMALGVIIAALGDDGTEVVEVAPISWQSYIGNNIYTRQKKGEVKKKYPTKSASWLKNHIREERKQFTIDYFNELYGLSIDDNDVSDAIGVGYYAVHNL